MDLQKAEHLRFLWLLISVQKENNNSNKESIQSYFSVLEKPIIDKFNDENYYNLHDSFRDFEWGKQKVFLKESLRNII